jgi:hypothetical protein
MNFELPDTTDIEPRVPFEPIPAGKYLAMITDIAEPVTTKSGTGSYMPIELTILDGEHKNRKVFDRLNLWNPSAPASEIAHRTLSAIKVAVGAAPHEKNPAALMNKPLVVTVKLTQQEGYNPKNDVTGYGPADQKASAPARPAPARPPVQAPPAPAQAAATKAPWKR